MTAVKKRSPLTIIRRLTTFSQGLSDIHVRIIRGIGSRSMFDYWSVESKVETTNSRNHDSGRFSDGRPAISGIGKRKSLMIDK